MGLDMYLTKKVYVKNWEHTPKENKSKISLKRGGKTIDTKNTIYIEQEVAYWRKANMIHNWFVENVQDGVDNCAQYYVDYNQLKELLYICAGLQEVYKEYKDKEKFKEVAEKLLPTTEGFFFGNYEYAEEYMTDIESTIEQLKDISKDEEYYYHSSW
tara:strand:- start:459 stop:929 length:471 start_codon:yes stop_codon:yes gene_type:complete